MADGPRFRPDRGGVPRGTPWSLIGLLALVTCGLVVRSFWVSAEGPPPALVEVVGEVPNPGTYALDDPTVHAAIRAAGGEPGARDDQPVPAGHRLVVTAAGARVERPSDPVLVSIPIDPNTAERHELIAIPGIGETLADRMVDDRAANGPYRDLEDLRRVPGLRAETLDRMEPFIALSEVGPVDPNHATSGELETLPGIGPVLAARIVVDRDANGPYATLADLERVEGIGPALLERLEGRLAVSP